MIHWNLQKRSNEIGISLGKNMKKKKEENVKDEKYVWIKNGPSVTTFYEPSEISPEFKESLFFLKLVHKKEEDKK